MKLVLLSILSVLALTNISYAKNAKVLECEGGNGGPAPSKATLLLVQTQGTAYTVQLRLINPIFPKGVYGAFAGNYNPQDRILRATGKIAGVQGNIRVSPTPSNGTAVVLYAGGDHRIEFGFGTIFICK